MTALLILAIGAASCHEVLGGKIHLLSPSSTNSVNRGLQSGHQSSRQGGAITLDPVSIISLLALGAFLINNILQLLRANQMMNDIGRSLEIPNINTSFAINELNTTGKHQHSRINEPGNNSSMMWTFFTKSALYFFTPNKRAACLNRGLFCSHKIEPSTFNSKILGLILSIVERIFIPGGTEDNSKKIVARV